MAIAFEKYLLQQKDVLAILGLGGSGGTALITPAMQSLAVGVPKLMLSTMASGDVSGYIGASDIAMMYSVTDISGLNVISRKILKMPLLKSQVRYFLILLMKLKTIINQYWH